MRTILSLIAVTILGSGCIASKETLSTNITKSDTYSRCIAAKGENLYSIGEYRNAKDDKYWVAFINDAIVDSVLSETTLHPSHVLETQCWLDGEERLNYVWPVFEKLPRKSVRLYHQVYHYRQKMWAVPEVIWENEGMTFNWEQDEASIYIGPDHKAHIAIEEEASNRAILLHQKDTSWVSQPIEYVNAYYEKYGTITFHWGGLPALTIDDQGRYYLAFASDIFSDSKPGESVRMNVLLIYSDDRGETWTDAKHVAKTIGTSRHGMDIWNNEDGLHILWLDNSMNKEVHRLGYVYSTDRGMTWSEPGYLETGGESSHGRDMCSDATGMRYMIVGDFSGRTLIYYKLEDRTWVKAGDVLKDFRRFEGIHGARLACEGSKVYLDANGIVKVNLSEEQEYKVEAFTTRLDRPIVNR